jgi:RNA polymerase-binding transcription factor
VSVNVEARRVELEALRLRMIAAAEGMLPEEDASGEINTAAGDQHIADHASDMLEHELDWTLEENAERILAEIEQALVKLDDGTYGRCAVCGEPIPDERLDAVPYATLCVRDKRLEERA